MTDFSQIKTLDQLEYQTQRLQRRADLQRRQLRGHFDFVIRGYRTLSFLTRVIRTFVR